MSPRTPPPGATSFSAFRQGASEPEPAGELERPGLFARSPKLRKISAYGGSAVMAVAALIIFSYSSSVSTAHEEALYEQAQPVGDAQSRIDHAQDGEAFLPDDTQAQQRLGQADEIGHNVEQLQNLYLEHAGPLVWQDIPEIDEEMRQTMHRPEPRTREEREEVAQQDRDEDLRGVQRRLHTAFDHDSRDAEGFTAAGRWDEQTPAVDDEDGTVSLMSYSWDYQDAQLYNQRGEIEAVWLLRDSEGETLAWVKGLFNPQSRLFEDLSLGTYDTEVEL